MIMIRIIYILIAVFIALSCAEHEQENGKKYSTRPFLQENKYLRHLSTRPEIPIIGILTLPCTGGNSNYCKENDKSFVPSTYPKWLASSGAQIVPLMYSEDDTYFDTILPKINGIFLTGGHYNKIYRQRVHKIISWVLNQNRKENRVPLWGTCLGFQFIVLFLNNTLANDVFVDKRIKVHPYINHLAMPNLVAGRIFDEERFPGALKIMKEMRKARLTYHQHHYGIARRDFENNKNLSSLLEVLATNIDDNGNEYVSIFQGKTFPIYGVQFHPEKTGFEPLIAGIHSREHHIAARHFSQFFVDEARKHSILNPPSDSLSVHLLQNYDLHFYTNPYSEIYVFDR
jgi:gamma-glutamyl hydrolase